MRAYQNNYHDWAIPIPQLELHCDKDGGVRWFDPAKKEIEVARWSYHFITYTCRNCAAFRKTYAVLLVPKLDAGKPLNDIDVYKLGEYLPFATPVSKRIEKLLEKEDLELFRRGMRSEAQGLGIGAATYFRRIVDSKWKLLVTEMRDAARELGSKQLHVFDAALNEIQFSKAVDMLKDVLPEKLLILNGENPLTLIYKPLSVGLHNLSDAECLQQAADIRMVLTALLENVADVVKDQDELKNAANRLKQPGKP